MRKNRRFISLLFALALCLSLFRPMPASAADLYFTSINDTVLPLTADTMPFWSGGILYVPYTVFDPGTAGVSLGLNSQYSRSSNSVSVYYKLQKLISFDLNTGLGRNETTGVTLDARAITRSGTPYLPLSTVCREFDLDYSYTTIRQGKLVRIKSSSVVLSDTRFIDAANDLINQRLKEYNQSLAPSTGSTGTTTPSVPSTPSTGTTHPSTEEVSPFSIRTYLAFRVTDPASAADILDSLDRQGVFALFLCSPEILAENDDLVRRIIGSGHSLGLTAEGDSLDQVRARLREGSRLLAQRFYTRTTIAAAPQQFRSALTKEGWVCWKETLPLSPSISANAGSFANATLAQLSGRNQSVFLTMETDAAVRRVLPTLLQRLADNRFVVSIPLETRL